MCKRFKHPDEQNNRKNYKCPICGEHGWYCVPVAEVAALMHRKGRKVLHTTAWTKPLPSLALGCHPAQSKEFNEKAREAGITGAYYDERGVCHVSTPGQRRKLLELRGIRDNDAGYQDTYHRMES